MLWHSHANVVRTNLRRRDSDVTPQQLGTRCHMCGHLELSRCISGGCEFCCLAAAPTGIFTASALAPSKPFRSANEGPTNFEYQEEPSVVLFHIVIISQNTSSDRTRRVHLSSVCRSDCCDIKEERILVGFGLAPSTGHSSCNALQLFPLCRHLYRRCLWRILPWECDTVFHFKASSQDLQPFRILSRGDGDVDIPDRLRISAEGLGQACGNARGEEEVQFLQTLELTSRKHGVEYGDTGFVFLYVMTSDFQLLKGCAGVLQEPWLPKLCLKSSWYSRVSGAFGAGVSFLTTNSPPSKTSLKGMSRWRLRHT
ncbi:uncharacterized protein IWZ02DRAFT_280763 [Phyllosticta citriasiana]|uniref:uncharacterized protein n=1 Tax=Phyllosticta citriasiana TaxID=595635 RepID=UPI0030FD7D5F